jgi:sugar/nucleoside kinase (ribokinase family)
MILVLGDLIADFSLHIPQFPVDAGDIQRATYLEIGPGGATNVAIAAGRLGLNVGCLGEVGDDRFGEVVVEGLRREGVDVAGVMISKDTETPVAGVVVDAQGEPAYLGYGGSLRLRAFHEPWRSMIQSADGLFTDGWAEHDGVPNIILDGMRVAHAAGTPTFFDPGPGNPDIDPAWVQEAIDVTSVLLLNEQEAAGLTGLDDGRASARYFLSRGINLIVLKQGEQGCYLLTAEEEHTSPGFRVEVKDATGAGDSLDAAIIYGYLKGIPLDQLGTLANAVGATKVRKLGTGHNVPTLSEVRSLLSEFGFDPGLLLP